MYLRYDTDEVERTTMIVAIALEASARERTLAKYVTSTGRSWPRECAVGELHDFIALPRDQFV